MCLIAGASMALADSGGGGGSPLATPVPTPDGVIVTAQMTAERCGQYKRVVDHWLEMDKSPEDDFIHLDKTHVPLVLSVMAKESACLTDVSDGQSIGLMQVIPRPWLPDVRSNGMNIYTGMYILDRSIELADGDVALALAYYNCGVPKVEADACGKRGGKHYAQDVLTFWYPYFMVE